MSGGHVLTVASEDSDIALVLSHVPFTDGFSIFSLYRVQDLFRLTGACLLDKIYQLARKVYYIPVVESPGKLGCMTNEGMKESYLAMVPEDSSWENKCAARVVLPLLFTRPCSSVHKITCPVLIVAGDNDTAVSTPAARKTARKIAACTFESLPMGHCDCYVEGPLFEQLFSRQLRFLREKIK